MGVRSIVGFGKALAVACSMTALLAVQPVSAASDIVSTLSGSWGGGGRITYSDGSHENINCSAYYSGSGNDLRMAIQCKSDRNPIHIRSTLRIDGSRVSGRWEERTFNVAGSASGTASSGHLSLNVSGGAFKGTMAVAYGRTSHTVTVVAEGIAMKDATMNLTRR